MSETEYQERFDTYHYLKRYDFKTSPLTDRLRHTLKFYHDAFLKIPSGVQVLDYGSGPVLMSTISAATKASEIVLAEYVESNRRALRQWIDAEPEAFAWSPQFSYVVKELEGKNDEGKVKEREEQVRNLVKAIVPCNINEDPPIERGYNQQYDVVISCLVMEGASTSLQQYQRNIARLGSFVKPGGTILYYGVENRLGYYSFGDWQFPVFFATAKDAMSGFERAGFKDLSLETFESRNEPNRVFRCISGIHI